MIFEKFKSIIIVNGSRGKKSTIFYTILSLIPANYLRILFLFHYLSLNNAFSSQKILKVIIVTLIFCLNRSGIIINNF